MVYYGMFRIEGLAHRGDLHGAFTQGREHRLFAPGRGKITFRGEWMHPATLTLDHISQLHNLLSFVYNGDVEQMSRNVPNRFPHQGPVFQTISKSNKERAYWVIDDFIKGGYISEQSYQKLLWEMKAAYDSLLTIPTISGDHVALTGYHLAHGNVYFLCNINGLDLTLLEFFIMNQLLDGYSSREISSEYGINVTSINDVPRDIIDRNHTALSFAYEMKKAEKINAIGEVIAVQQSRFTSYWPSEQRICADESAIPEFLLDDPVALRIWIRGMAVYNAVPAKYEPVSAIDIRNSHL